MDSVSYSHIVYHAHIEHLNTGAAMLRKKPTALKSPSTVTKKEKKVPMATKKAAPMVAATKMRKAKY